MISVSVAGYHCVFCKGPVQGGAWVHSDGELTHAECASAYRESLYIYECPKCEGGGNWVLEEWPSNKGPSNIRIRACPLCEGKGKLKHRPIPIDWKLECE